MGGKDSKQQKKKQQAKQEEQEEEQQEVEQENGQLAGPKQGQQPMQPDSVNNLIAMISNRSGPQKSNQNRPQIIVGESPSSSSRRQQQQQNIRFIELIDLQAKVSERAQTDKGRPLKLTDTGQLKIASNILDLRFNRAKRQLELIRDLDNTVTSELQWIVKKEQKCIEFTLIDKTLTVDEEVIKLKNKVIFYTTLSGSFIGVKAPPRKNGMSPSYFEELESEMRFFWESMKPIKTRQETKKSGIFTHFTSKSLMDNATLMQIYNRRWLKTISTKNNQGDLWQVHSDDGRKKEKQAKPQEVKYEDFLFNEVQIQSFYYQDILWPCICQYVMRNQVLIDTDMGIKLDFYLKVVTMKIQSNIDKLPEKVLQATQTKQQELLEKNVKEFDQLSQTEFGKIMMSLQ